MTVPLCPASGNVTASEETVKSPVIVSKSRVAGGLVFTAGQMPFMPGTRDIPEGIAAQVRQSLDNVKAVLEAAGTSMGKVVKVTIFLQNMDDFAVMNEIYATYFDKDYPARSTVEVARLCWDALVEIEAIAVQ